MPIPLLPPDDVITPFPTLACALKEPNGLLMAGGSLAPQRLLKAYEQGIFPWYSEGEPVLWWSPDPRCVLWPDALHISRSLIKTLNSGRFECRVNTAFAEVVENCRKPRPKSTGTWILPEIVQAYLALHKGGYAHSYETWCDNKLVGGLYGVQLGEIFFGESMFSHQSDASKFALIHVCRNPEVRLIDCQVTSAHLLRLGATTIPRAEFVQLLKKYISPTSKVTIA